MLLKYTCIRIASIFILRTLGKSHHFLLTVRTQSKVVKQSCHFNYNIGTRSENPIQLNSNKIRSENPIQLNSYKTRSENPIQLNSYKTRSENPVQLNAYPTRSENPIQLNS